MANNVRTLDFLPEIFQTSSNRQFLEASLDVLTSQPNLKRVEGFIGQRYGYGIGPRDRYVVEPSRKRRNYQLDPAVVFLKPETQTAKDFINYDGILQSLEQNGADVSNHNRLFSNEFYSWDPFVDYDKIVNYAQYYWLPNGPDAVPIYNTTVYNQEDYIVATDDNGYTFDGIPGTNPTLTLLRGGIYEIAVNAGLTPFWIQTVPGVDATTTERTITGVTNNGTSNGGIIFNVPDKATLVSDTLYYQSGTDPFSVGIIKLIESNADNYIDVDTIIGRKTYTSPNGVRFTNGLKVTFDEYALPELYRGKNYYVDGVGTSIVLLPESHFIAAEITGEVIYNPWSYDPWDIENWDAQLYVPVTPEYITVSRHSRDYNAWTRANRWFHQDVLDVTKEALGYVTARQLNTVTRAERPIIEFRGNLKLYNLGITFLGFLNILDTFTTDAFSDIEGKTITQVGPIDGQYLFDGSKIVFAADANPIVRQNVYVVRLVPTLVPGEDIINLVPDTTVTVKDGSQVTVLYVSGATQSGSTWWFEDSTKRWISGQKKVLLNQAPLYDIFNSSGYSIGENTAFSGSSFTGTKLFSYAVGDGPNDPVLGFPIQYSSFESIGDIVFNVNLNSDIFTYNNGQEQLTSNINIGFVHWYREEDVIENLSGWVKAEDPSIQPLVFEFPLITNLKYSSQNVTIAVENGGTGYAVGDKLVIPGSAIGGRTPRNNMSFTVSSVAAGGAITGIDTDSITGRCLGLNQIFLNVNSVSVEGVGANPPSGSSAQFNIVLSGAGTVSFTCDVLAKTDPDETKWSPVTVYYNDTILDESLYTVVRDQINHTTTVTVPGKLDVKVTVLIISDDKSKVAYYQIPSNLQNNPFNENLTTVAVGDLKNQYRSIYINSPYTTGQIFGNNNIHDLGNLNNYGTSIIQNSASLVLPGLFLRKPELNFFNAVKFNSDQYQNFKILLLDLAAAKDYNNNTPPSNILDDIIYEIGTSRNQNTPFFWSDMIFSGNPYLTNTYNFATDIDSATLSLSPEIWSQTLFTEANYKGIGVYLTRPGPNKPITMQLVRGVHYVVSTTTPSLTVNFKLLDGDKITVNEYNQTYGSYCPSTPSKLGLYPIWIPEVVSPPNTTRQYIRGHDGSLNRLFGTYTLEPVTGLYTFDDFRDQVLFEFETRVYNNFKVSGDIPLKLDDVIPGQFRTTDYSRNEILDIYSTGFLNWVGTNRLDYRTQYYNQSNKFTYNYNQSTNKLTNTGILQGYWKGLYQWLYDTVDPAGAPWEMLGFVTKPSWWDSRYGAAPYTSGNTYMWNEIAAGYIWNDGNPYIDTKKIRPGLLKILPVDSYGDLVDPFVSVVSDYSPLTFSNNWIIGDGAPVENAYLSSSTWPFYAMMLLAVTKPAKYFNLFADRDKYKYNDSLLTPGQYLYNSRYHLNPKNLEVYGKETDETYGTPKHSYINWIVDYNNQRGANGTDVVKEGLTNLDVRLTYNVAGFTAKNYLKFLVEKATPNSRNTSLLIPDENYAVLLYDNPPQEKINFSSVIVQKTANGWTVWGNSKDKNYFTTVEEKPLLFKKITVRNETIQVSNEFYSDRIIQIPYGTEFHSVQATGQFLLNYGQYLSRQGIVFNNTLNGIVYDWFRMVEEFMAWTQNGWEVGSIISLNPSSREFLVYRAGLIPQPLTIHGENFILNANLLPIQNQNMYITRQKEALKIKVLSPADTVAYASLNLNSIEHAIVFDNFTSFNDTIYNLVTGLRQSRLLMQGYKTGDWSGYVNTNGFILNENNVKEWQPNTKYPKNIIVLWKNKYYTARKLIEPASEFLNEDWLETDYSKIKEGLLPNPSTEAYEAQFYYDTTRANLENDADLLAFSLIGFRPRQYMVSADLSDITQVNVYKNIVRYKGTTQLAESFRGARFPQGVIDYTIQENWAIKNGDMGAVLNSNFVEARLDQGLLKGNPTLLGFAAPDTTVPGVQQSVPINELINWERPPLTQNFLPPKHGSYTTEIGIPSAGFVNLNDSKFQRYTFDDLNGSQDIIPQLYSGDIIWLANYKNTWSVYTAVSLENQIIIAQNNLNGTVTLTFENIHNLKPGELIVVFNIDQRIDGFYTVKSVQSIYQILVDLSLDTNIRQLTGSGTGFKLVNRRFEQASDAAATVLPNSEWNQRKIWVDYDVDAQWAVWSAGVAYKQKSLINESGSFGVSVAQSEQIGILVADGAGNLRRYWGDGNNQLITGVGYGPGTIVVASGLYAYCTSPDEGKVYIFQLNESVNYLDLHQMIDMTPVIGGCTGAIAVGTDAQWMYIANATTGNIAIYSQNNYTTLYTLADTFNEPLAPSGSGWGASLATSVDGTKLVVGAPYETVGGVLEAGAAYVYSRMTQRFYGDGTTTVFTLIDPAPNNVGDVAVNDVKQVTTAAIVGSNVTVFIPDPDDPITLIAPPAGSIISVDTGVIEFVQKFTSDLPHQDGWFGVNVDTNRYGADIIIGAPYEISTVDGAPAVEGAVYRYTNPGQRYGVVTTEITGSLSGYIFINGWLVFYSGSITDIRDDINTQTPTNIIATSTGTTLTITVKDDTPEVRYNIIDITGPRNYLLDLGIIPYTSTQTIKNFNLTNVSGFGYNVKMNERDSLLITALNDDYISPTTFDYTDDCIQNDTIFDNGCTAWIDNFGEQGVVYLYDYLPAFNESITNPGQYAFGQYINTADIAPGTPSPKFGYSLSYANSRIVAGIPAYAAITGAAAVYDTTWVPEYPCQVNSTTSWYIDKKPLPIVDINAVNNISIYDYTTNETLEYLDYIDPLQGKLLGALATNIDYMDSSDPAVYNVNGVSWTWDHLGETWLDLGSIRLLNYHQPDVAYNAKNWGKAFPGSTADIYTWIESDVSPLNYNGIGFPLNFDKYTTSTKVDNSTNSLVTKYYFWIKNFDVVPPGKTLSPLICSAYLLDPINSGISYLAPITTNIVSLTNSSNYVQTNTSALHLGYGITKGQDDKHTSWNLIRIGDPESFLDGIPPVLGGMPSGLYLKFIESFTGVDEDLNKVPDPRLPELVKYGTAFRPRQSMFINRREALKNYLTYANDLLITMPIVEMRDISYLENFGATYDTRDYWEYVNWWAPGYNNFVKPILEVTNVNDLQTITENELLVSIAGTNVFLENGLIVKVAQNPFGKAEYYIYDTKIVEQFKWRRIGAENSTIQISPELWGLYGWDSEAWGIIWDKDVTQETKWIIRWLNEQCYIDELNIEKNKSLELMFNFIQSESLQQNNYLPWLNKTSLVDVKHRIRSLLPYKKYQRDNQEFLSGFLEEIKPYHVFIKDFVYSYDGLDNYGGNVIDFDLPAQYDTVTGKFITPQITYGTPYKFNQVASDSLIWQDTQYNGWRTNYGVSLAEEKYIGYPVTQLQESITATALNAIVKNTFGLPVVGSVVIGTEEINYSYIDYSTNTLVGLTRGINGTTPAAHIANSTVSLNVPPVVVYAAGRGYTEPPKIAAYIDTNIWPEPTKAAEFTPVMAAGQLIGVTVNNPGAGYVVEPQLIVQGSSIADTFSSAGVNTTTNTITITGHPFVTGDPVVYTVATGTSPVGLTTDTYYYVRVIDSNTIALYSDYIQATIDPTSPYLHVDSEDSTQFSPTPSTIVVDGRINLISTGSGTDHTLTVTARLGLFTTSSPVREFKISLKFDRLSYTTAEGAGSAVGRIDEYYSPTLSMPGRSLPQLMTGVEYPNNILLGDNYADKWDWNQWDIYNWQGSIDQPVVETLIESPDYAMADPTFYDEEGDPYPDSYGPEELVACWLTDQLTITVISNDLIPEWTHTIKVDKFGGGTVFNNSMVLSPPDYWYKWWYSVPGLDPATDPTANTTLSLDINTIPVFLRS